MTQLSLGNNAHVARCSMHPASPRFIKQVDGFCWNDNGDQPPAPNTITVDVDLGEGVPCPSTAAEFARLNTDLFTVSDRLLQASAYTATVLWEPAEPGNCVPVSCHEP